MSGVDLDADRLAQVAANIIARVGVDAVLARLPRATITPPPPGRAVLACGCGRMCDADQLRRLPLRLGDHRFVRPIVCPRCAS